MLKRTLVILSLAIALVVVAQPLQKVQGVVMTGSEWLETNTVEPYSSSATNVPRAEGQGNGFLRALGAPFKAFGRLFGKGKKANNKIERISAKDAKRFESTPATQVGKATPTTVASTGYVTESPGTTNAVPNSLVQSPQQTLETIARDHLEKGRDLLNNHDLNGAISELSRAAAVNPKLAEASTLLGVAYWRKGLRDVAERSFENAVKLQKDDAQNLNNFGFLLYENGDYEKATKYFKRAAKLAPNDARVWNNLGLAQSERGHFEDAYESFAKAQGEYKGHVNVGARLQQIGNTKKAIKHLEKAMALQPNSPEVLARLVVLYHDEGDEKLAQDARSSLQRLQTLAQSTDK